MPMIDPDNVFIVNMLCKPKDRFIILPNGKKNSDDKV